MALRARRAAVLADERERGALVCERSGEESGRRVARRASAAGRARRRGRARLAVARRELVIATLVLVFVALGARRRHGLVARRGRAPLERCGWVARAALRRRVLALEREAALRGIVVAKARRFLEAGGGVAARAIG